MTIQLTQDYGRWKKGDIVVHDGSLAERLLEQGKAVAIKETMAPVKVKAVEKPEPDGRRRKKAAEQHEP